MTNYGTQQYGTGTYGYIATAQNAWQWDTANSRLVAQGQASVELHKNDLLASDFEVFLISNQIDDISILLRIIDSNNRYRLKIGDNIGLNGPIVSLYRVTTGGGTVLLRTGTVGFPRGTYHTYRVTLVGAFLSVWFDGVLSYTYVDATPIVGIGQVGLDRGTGLSYVNNFGVRALGQSATGKVVYDKVNMTSTDPLTSPSMTDLVMCVRHPNIATGAVIQQTQNWKNTQTVAGAYDDVSKQSAMSWRLNEVNQLVMQPRDGSIAPFVLADVNGNIDAAAPPVVTRQSTQYRNRQYVRGAVDLEQVPESKYGNGVDTSWQLSYPVDSIVSITMNAQQQTFGIQNTDSGKTFYYTHGEKTITLDSSVLAPAARIDFVYIAQIPYTAIAEDANQQALLALLEEASGIYEASEDGAGMDKAAADALAEARLVENAVLAVNWKSGTMQGGLLPGQLLTVIAPQHAIVDMQFLITNVNTQVRQKSDGTLAYWYDIEVTTGPSVGAWARSLQTRLLLKKGKIS